MIKKLILGVLLGVGCYGYEDAGIHYMANCAGCDSSAISNNVGLFMMMVGGCCEAGATVVNWCGKEFPNGGMTLCITLEESHATIHTYPEFNSCFIDLFTCGDSCDYHKCEELIKKYLNPTYMSTAVIERTTDFKVMVEEC